MFESESAVFSLGWLFIVGGWIAAFLHFEPRSPQRWWEYLLVLIVCFPVAVYAFIFGIWLIGFMK